MKSLFLFGFLILLTVSVIPFDGVYGHGVGSETFPPVDLNGKLVTLEVSSSQSDPQASDDQQISVSLIDFDSKVTLRDVTFLINAERGEQFLFNKEFAADDGFLVFNFVSKETDSIIIEEETGGNFFGSLLGFESRMIHVTGPKLSEGGLYKLDVSVLTADGYAKKLDVPLVFNAGISIPQTTSHGFVDPNFGVQNIGVITYYDTISGFDYDSDSKEISFFMPFEWTQSNINQTSVVHKELAISKTFGDLLVSGFSVYVNGVELSKDIVNVDDFFADDRVVHFIIPQRELQNIFDGGTDMDGMNFLIRPDRDDTHLSSVTDNGQFGILVSWEPENLESDSDAKILFDVTDIFLRERPIAIPYDFSVTQDDRVIFEQNGISSDSKDIHNTAEFTVPGDISGIVNLNFENLDDNPLAKSAIPIVINRVAIYDEISLPEWIRNNALWWSQGQIDDATFTGGIEYMIQSGIISIRQTTQDVSESQGIPSWIKSNAEWWADGQISDETFVQGLEYLVSNGFIRI